MTVQSSQSVTVLFSTRVFATGVGTIADSLPTGTLYLNGVSNAASVTVTNISGGLYKAQVTMPTLAAADQVELSITATVSSITDTAIIWGDTNDIIASSGIPTVNSTQLAGQTVTAAAGVTFPTSVASPTNITAGTITTVTNLTNAATAGDFTSTMKTSLNNATPVATLSGDLTSTMKTSVTTAATAATPTIAGYTGNTPQTGDSFARIGVAGIGLTNLGDTRIGNLDAAISTRSVYSGGAVASVTAAVTVTGTPDVNVKTMNGATVYGNGSLGNLWRGTV